MDSKCQVLETRWWQWPWTHALDTSLHTQVHPQFPVSGIPASFFWPLSFSLRECELARNNPFFPYQLLSPASFLYCTPPQVSPPFAGGMLPHFTNHLIKPIRSLNGLIDFLIFNTSGLMVNELEHVSMAVTQRSLSFCLLLPSLPGLIRTLVPPYPWGGSKLFSPPDSPY